MISPPATAIARSTPTLAPSALERFRARNREIRARLSPRFSLVWVTHYMAQRVILFGTHDEALENARLMADESALAVLIAGLCLIVAPLWLPLHLVKFAYRGLAWAVSRFLFGAP